MKVSEEDKKTVLQAQKIFPEVWVFLQREANRNTSWPDVLLSLKELLKCGSELRVPWGFLDYTLKEIKRKREQKGIDEKVEKWQSIKIKREQDLKNWLKGVGE
jgi:hypothetical protein